MSEKVTATGTDIDSWVNSEMETTPEVQDHKQNQNISDSNKSNNNSIQNLETFPNPEKHQEYTPVSFPDPELKPQSRSKSQSQPQSQIRSYSQSPTKSNQSSHMPLPSPQPLPVLPPLPMRKTSTGGMALPPRPSTSPLLNSKISPSLSPSLAPPSPSSSSSSSSSSSPSSPLSLKDSHHHRTRMLNTKIELQLDDMEDSIMHRMGDSKQDSGNNSPNGDNERDEDVEGDAEADAEGEAFPEPIIDRGEMIEQNDQEYVQSPHSSFSYYEDSNEEIDGISNNNIILEYPNLEFKSRDCYELSDEINDWFTSNEIKSLLSIRKIYESYVHPNDNLKIFHKMSQDDKIKFLKTLSMNLEFNDKDTNKKESLFSIISLSYISMGNYGKIENQFNHMNQIKKNCKLLNFKLDDNQTILNPIIKLIVKYLNKLTNFKKNVNDNKFNFEELHNIDLKLLKSYADQLYHLMTILYFCLCIYLDEEDKNNYDYNNLDDMASDSDSDEDEDEDENDDDVGGGENTDILSNSLNNSNNNGINGTRLKNGGINGYNDSKNINKKSAKLYSDLKTYEEESNNNSTIPYNDETYDLLRDEIDKSDLLSTIVKSIDRWRWLSCENDEKENSSVNGGNSANITNGGAGNGISGNGSANGGTSSSNNQSQDNFIAVKISKVFQIRNIIKLFSKLILFQFGGEHKLNSVKSFLNYIHEDTNNKGDNNSNDDDDDDDDNSKKEYTISPSQYHNFRNELMVRYPVYSPPQYELPDIIDICLSDPNILNGNNSSNGINSGEIGINGSNTDYDPSSDLNPTNLVSMPKKLTVSTLTTLLGHEHLNGIVNNSKSKIPHYPSSSQPPDIHIATPAPSPTLTPQHTGNSRSHSSNSAELDLGLNTKGRRLFNTNPHFPNIYPIDGAGSGNGGVDGDNIPFSIREATSIFFNNIKDDIYNKQFTKTIQNFMEQELIDSENNDNFYKNNNIKDDEFKYNDLKFISSNPMFINEIRILNRIDKFYENSLSSLNSIIKVFIQLLSSNIFTSNTIKFSKDYELKLKNNNYKRDISNYDKEKLELIKLKESTLRSISNIIFYLLKWFKRSNIMKFEYFSSLLYDNDFYFKYIKFLNCNQINVEFINSLDLTDTEILMKNRVINCEYKILDNYKEYNFFKMAMEHSTIHNKFKYKINEKDKKLVKIIEYENETYEYFMPPFNGQSKYNIKNPNWRYCSILITLFKVLYMTLYKTKTQRIYKLLETRPTEVFRFYLSNFNEEMYRPILKIVKLISPFSGKKWRSNNMDLISLVYLFYRVGLTDSWLTNYFSNNLSERIKKSWECEYSLRSLIQFYNMINYKDAMKSMGYELTNDYSFFGPELERLITEEMNEMSTDTTYD